MNRNKEILILVETFVGGVGTVAKNLSTSFAKTGYKVYIIPTLQPRKEALELLEDWPKPNQDIEIYYIKDDTAKYSKIIPKVILFLSKIILKFFEKKQGNLYKRALIQKRYGQTYRKSFLLEKFLKNHPDIPIIALAHNPIMLVLPVLKKNRMKNKIIISERSSQDEINGRTMDAFIRLLYKRADHMVFQSFDVCDWYKQTYGINGSVIFNPIKENLPQPYEGERQKKIVNFCRISSVKNLPLLMKSFSRFLHEHPEYELYIYGDVDESAKEYGNKIIEELSLLPCKEKIHISPAIYNIHDIVKDYAMFVSSSDYEGMSNSMIEAMAIGLPTICTDCPAGGARAVIKDHENGLLVPIKDEIALCNAMSEIAANPDLANSLSSAASVIRYKQSADTIAQKWLSLIETD